MTFLQLPSGGQPREKVRIDVEVCCRPDCAVEPGAVREAVGRWLASLATVRYSEGPVRPPPGEYPLLDASVESIAFVDLGDAAKPGCQVGAGRGGAGREQRVLRRLLHNKRLRRWLVSSLSLTLPPPPSRKCSCWPGTWPLM